MSAVAEEVLTRESVHAELMSACRGDRIDDTLARMIASWVNDAGALPDWLGLAEPEFTKMMQHHYPAFDTSKLGNPGKRPDLQRGDEMDDLRTLLIKNRTGHSESEYWMVDIVIAGCLGNDHLWQDLGLWCRGDLSKLMMDNFKPLAERNNKDMKWKKFLYKQLCETEGIYTCRAPSCEVCADYDNCFGPEE